jgi:protein Tex
MVSQDSSSAVISRTLSKKLGLEERSVKSALALIDEGCTIPFIARYRKDQTGGLSDEDLRGLDEALTEVRALEDRRDTIRKSLEKQGFLTDELSRKLKSITSKQGLEDFYLPYKPSRHTKADKARKKGLEGLAKALLATKSQGHPRELAKAYISAAKEVATVDEALEGALDILVDQLANRADIRAHVREKRSRGFLTIKAARGKKDDAANSVYRDLVGLHVRVSSLKGHRVLAIDRGERENLLSVKVEGEQKWEIQDITRFWLPHNFRPPQATYAILQKAVEQALADRIGPACEKDVRKELSEAAQTAALETFRVNLRALLRSPPLKRRTVLGIDPGFRSGCKIALIDERGKYLASATIYPTTGKAQGAEKTVRGLLEKYPITVVAIGNGTASRETGRFVRDLLKNFQPKDKRGISQIIVSEAGASVYSASKLASEEHPELDVTIRGALSIARRVLDPLAELVKIDPKSLGVGQYQHDIDGKRLDSALGGIVEQVVNEVGVDLNRASVSLLSYVSGIGPKLAKTIVKQREKRPFASRAELLKVAGLGKRTYQQAAGFLRVPESKETLDHTAVHPESYALARQIASTLKTTIGELAGNKTLLDAVQPEQFLEGSAGLQTILDILDELAQPGRDPRGEAQSFEYTDGIETVEDLSVGLKLKGTVTNVTDFGAFVDIGVHRDGLIHISKFGRRVQHPSDMVSVGELVDVVVESVDKERGRISLRYQSD